MTSRLRSPETVAHALVSWFRSDARALPWRIEPRDPYHTLVSELMAQQTQLDRVVPRFEVFVARFPDLGALAAATEEEVLEAWSGLGYYRRARLLHRLSREVVAGDGELPSSADDLERLPGIGPYTAAAVASMVFGEAVPSVDGNIGRVGARVLALAEDPRNKRGRAAIEDWVGSLMGHAPPGQVNEALMELGATRCRPNQPVCGNCPLARGCRALLEGDPTAYPPPRRTRAAVDLCWLAVIIEDPNGRWLLRQITEGPILRGLWLPPVVVIDPRRHPEDQVLEALPFDLTPVVEFSKPIKHSITHRRIEVTPARVVIEPREGVAEGWSWAHPTKPDLPTSSILGKLLASVSSSTPASPFDCCEASAENE